LFPIQPLPYAISEHFPSDTRMLDPPFILRPRGPAPLFVTVAPSYILQAGSNGHTFDLVWTAPHALSLRFPAPLRPRGRLSSLWACTHLLTTLSQPLAIVPTHSLSRYHGPAPFRMALIAAFRRLQPERRRHCVLHFRAFRGDPSGWPSDQTPLKLDLRTFR